MERDCNILTETHWNFTIQRNYKYAFGMCISGKVLVF